MLKQFIQSEIKKWTRDSISKFILFYPFLIAAIGVILVRALEAEGAVDPMIYEVLLVALALMTPLMYGFIVGFSILDDRDDNILISISTTPLSFDLFILVKLVMAYVATVLSTTIVFLILRFAWGFFLPIHVIVLLAITSSFATPFFVLLINIAAKNKVEGFAIVKALGIFVIFPIASLFFSDWKEWLFVVAPQYWAAKAVSAFSRGMINEDPTKYNLPLEFQLPMPQIANGYVYLLIGAVVLCALSYLAFKGFKKKIIF